MRRLIQCFTPRRLAKLAAATFAQLTMLLAVFGLVSQPAMADVGSEMNSYFNAAGSSANVTGPAAFNGQSAGYYSGGSVWSRFPQKSINPVSVALPSARAGCGGIDLFAGSFSFINADEMVATLKATANNAIGFAFQLAIDSISAQIGGVMKDMSQRVQALNAFNMSSCEAAQQAIGSIWPKMDGASSTICQQVGGAKGFFSDAASARHGCTNKGEREDTIAKGGDDAELVQSKNYTWYALNAKSATKPSKEYAEFLMTMVGTIIYDSTKKADSMGGFRFIAPASWDTYQALLDGTASAPTDVWSCDTTDDKGCLSPRSEKLSIPTEVALRTRVLKMMDSMSAKIRSNAALSGDEINLLGMTSIPLYKILVVNEAAHMGLGSGDKATLSEMVAIDLLISMLDRMLDTISQAQQGANYVSTTEFETWRKQVDSVKTELARRSTKMAGEVQNTYRVIQQTQFLESTLKNTMSPQMTASLRFGRGLSSQGLR
ncbi:conjugal transfer protein (plasmid) [Sphingomonas sp. AAP5]|uniref:conjugal transfer protein TraH n=2 Tax=Pseudomonadota TaxID=1224 RepID=UPI001057033D|nr:MULTISPECIES: conjugal transfer protein TraH [unclassified Sphingomonas]MBB3588830.1 conjugative transfer pilus assembly protein TraH [Sphingomonas sp. BK481]QBM78055.1 conjugal transfer protein [Sphingomonas sp. AAP5]RZL84989.1 MAG: conjugal transfer protein [Sphingomonas sp.]